MLITLLIVILNLSLSRVYRIAFLKYMYIISLVTVIYSVIWGIISLYLQWLFTPPHANQSHALGSIILGHVNYLNLVPGVYQLAVPLFTALVFLTYKESGANQTA